jgi:dihydroorotate dehydrogenase
MLPLEFASPWLNAAGSLGFAPDARGPVDLSRLGAFVTNPISARPRRAAAGARLANLDEGVWLHSGHPNPGFRRVLDRYRAAWGRAVLPIIPHLLADQPEDLRRMVPQLESLGNVHAIEIGIPPEAGPELARALVAAAVGERPIIARIGLDQVADIAAVAMEAGASAVSLGAPRVANPEGQAGRVYGRQVLEQALAVTRSLVAAGIPTLAAGGVFGAADGQQLLDAGALAVQIDIALWRGKFEGW